jgi:hypothetical protein
VQPWPALHLLCDGKHVREPVEEQRAFRLLRQSLNARGPGKVPERLRRGGRFVLRANYRQHQLLVGLQQMSSALGVRALARGQRAPRLFASAG